MGALRPQTVSLSVVFMVLLFLSAACLAGTVWVGGPVDVLAMAPDNFDGTWHANVSRGLGAVKLVVYGIYCYLFQAGKALFFAETAHVMDSVDAEKKEKE